MENDNAKLAGRPKAKWIILGVTVLLALFALLQINRLSNQIKQSEKQKVRIWASAISQKAQLVSYTEHFFHEVGIEEHSKMQLHTEALREFAEQPLGRDVGFCYNYISANTTIPVIITDADSNITSYNNFDLPEGVTKLEGELMKEFSKETPVHYKIWGMPFTLYYKESRIYSDLRNMLEGFTQSFLSEITNNSVFVPVIIVDSSKTQVMGSGNLPEHEFSTAQKLQRKLHEMERENDPIQILLPDNCKAYVYYESTPLLKSLRWVPLLYLFVVFVLVLVSYNLFRTARSMEQNRIWVGMAKETAHQLGTPISSLIAWTDYLEDKTLEGKYAVEIRKDLSRLETITHRFSKIGSVPELKPSDVCAATRNAINYLQSRSSKKIQFVANIPDEPIIVPLNSYLFEWVIENICKNAIDAMNGAGTFTTIVSHDARHVYIDLCDTGKGMTTAQQKRVFESGYTTKQRGWGLGLSLARRIINEYHKGRIYVKYSIPNQGSVFRIELNKSAQS